MASGSSPCEPDAYSAAPSSRLALLIGIDEYLVAEPRLAGCINDVVDMQNLLTQRYQFKKEDVFVLTNCQATHDNIMDAFRKHLIDRAAKDAVVVFYFSGHGGQIRDLENEEADGKDELIVTYDSGTRPDSSITDDDLAKLVDELSKKTSNSTFIFDSCHSGTMIGKNSRWVQGLPKTLPPPAKPGFFRKISGFRQQLASIGGGGPVLIAGCLDWERAYQRTFDRVVRGVLTYYLTGELRSFGERNPSYQELMHLVCPAVHTECPAQTPVLTGDVDRAVFGVDRPASNQAFAIARKNGLLSLAAGSLQGMTEGSRLEVTGPATEGGRPVNVEVVVDQVMPLQSLVRVSKGELARPVSLARLVAYSPSSLARSIFVAPPETPAAAAVKHRLEAWLSEAGYQQALVRHEAEFSVSVDRDGAGGTVQVGGRGAHVTAHARQNLADTLIEEVRHWTRWLAVARRDNPNSQYRPKLTVTAPSHPRGTVRPAEKVTLTVTNDGGPAFYGTLVVLSDDGRITQVYRQDDAITAGWSVTADLSLPDDRAAMSYFVKVLAGRKPLDLSSLGIDPANLKIGTAIAQPTAGGPDDWAAAIAEIRVVR